MTNKTVTMSRELAERMRQRLIDLGQIDDFGPELFQVLNCAVPVVERQPEQIYQVRYLGDGGGGWSDVDKDEFGLYHKNSKNYQTRTVFASPAPVAVVLPTREVMRDLIAEVIGGDTYDCTRVWSAWSVGTMSEDDFVPVVEQEERLYELADACLDKVKEMNQ